jgi:hypothetical protein
MNTSFASTILRNVNVHLSVDDILSRLISDELNLEVTQLTSVLRLSLSQTTSLPFYSFGWRCMRKAQLMCKMDAGRIFPKVSSQQRSNDTVNLGRVKLEIVLPRQKYQRVYFLLFFLWMIFLGFAFIGRRGNWIFHFAYSVICEASYSWF